jgi:hypothetical protein
MSLIEDILWVLAEDPFGEVPVSEIRTRAASRASDTETITNKVRNAIDAARLGRSSEPRPSLPTVIFGELITCPEVGIWKITNQGREYLRSLDPAKVIGAIHSGDNISGQLRSQVPFPSP